MYLAYIFQERSQDACIGVKYILVMTSVPALYFIPMYSKCSWLCISLQCADLPSCVFSELLCSQVMARWKAALWGNLRGYRRNWPLLNSPLTGIIANLLTSSLLDQISWVLLRGIRVSCEVQKCILHYVLLVSWKQKGTGHQFTKPSTDSVIHK